MALTIDRKAFGSLAKQDRLVPHLDKVIGQGDFVWSFDYEPKKEDDAWHPSGDCTPSLAELYAKASGTLIERPITTSLYKTFMVGHFWHQYIQYLLSEKLEFCDKNAIERRGCKVWDDCATPSPFWWVTGSADVAPVTLPVHGDYLLDIKTMNAHDFNSPNIPAWTKDKWECQVNIYMDFFDLDRAIILGVMKDSPHTFKEFEFNRNQALIDAIYFKWKLVGVCLDQNIEPPLNENVDLPLQGPIR